MGMGLNWAAPVIAFWSWCLSNVSAGVLIIIILSAARSRLLCLFQPRLSCWVSGVHVLAVLAVWPLHTWQLPAERVGGWHAGGYLIGAGKPEGKEDVVLQAEGLGGIGACWHRGTDGWFCGLNPPVSAQQSPCLVVEPSWALRSLTKDKPSSSYYIKHHSCASPHSPPPPLTLPPPHHWYFDRQM